jgi:hypothetical protein
MKKITKFDAFLIDHFMTNLLDGKGRKASFWLHIIFKRSRQIYGLDIDLDDRLDKYIFDVIASYRYTPEAIKIARKVVSVLKKLINEEEPN